MTHVTCRLTAKSRDQLRNPTLRNRVWATFFIICGRSVVWCVGAGGDVLEQAEEGAHRQSCRRRRHRRTDRRRRTTTSFCNYRQRNCADTVHSVKWRHRVYGHDTIAILWVQQDIICRVKWRRFVVLFKQNWISWFRKMSASSLTCHQKSI